MRDMVRAFRVVGQAQQAVGEAGAVRAVRASWRSGRVSAEAAEASQAVCAGAGSRSQVRVTLRCTSSVRARARAWVVDVGNIGFSFGREATFLMFIESLDIRRSSRRLRGFLHAQAVAPPAGHLADLLRPARARDTPVPGRRGRP